MIIYWIHKIRWTFINFIKMKAQISSNITFSEKVCCARYRLKIDVFSNYMAWFNSIRCLMFTIFDIFAYISPIICGIHLRGDPTS